MNKLVAFFLVLALGIGGVVGLSVLRKKRWEATQNSSRLKIPSMSVEDVMNEKEIVEATKVDESIFDKILGLRIIKRVPRGLIELEAAYRQRKPDSCEVIVAKEPLALNNWTNQLTTRDAKRTATNPLEFTRRSVMTVGLSISDSDRESLPMLSRQIIADFLKEHYVNLQARIVRDPTNGNWYLHHRPLAAVAKFRGVPLTEDMVDPILQTTNDIRGLGLLKSNNDPLIASAQTAVWLFRSSWQAANDVSPNTHYEFAFIQAVPQNDPKSPDPFSLYSLITSEQRNKFHFLKWRLEGKQQPTSLLEADLVGAVHFVEFASDGLHPKRTVTRSGTVRGQKDFSLNDINTYLASKNLNGPWEDHVLAILEGVIQNKLAVQKELP